jgi:thiol:disulfide interchange protein DsbD
MTSVGVLSRVAVLLLVFAGAAAAQGVPVQWSVTTTVPQSTVGTTFVARVHAMLPDGWHIYATSQPPGGPIATTFVPLGDAFASAGAVKARAPHRSTEALTGLPIETYDDTVTFLVPVLARAESTVPLALRVRYQLCTASYCTAPRADTVRVHMTVRK